jgi:hypothetical protein
MINKGLEIGIQQYYNELRNTVQDEKGNCKAANWRFKEDRSERGT